MKQRTIWTVLMPRKKEIISKGVTIEPKIERLATDTFKLLKKIPKPSKELTILYKHQKIRKLIGEHKFVFNNKKFVENVKFAKRYWLGERKAAKVKRQNSWKCNYCEFRRRCSIDKSQTTLF